MSQGNRHDTEGFLRQVATGTLFTVLRAIWGFGEGALGSACGGRFSGIVSVSLVQHMESELVIW